MKSKAHASVVAAVLLLLSAVPAAAQSDISALSITIETGDDDLRGGSNAFAELRFPDGRFEPKLNLNHGEGWSNKSKHTVTMPLSRPYSPEELSSASMRISFDGSPRNAFDGYDNWRIDAINVTAERLCAGGELIALGRGDEANPWHRFTDKARSTRLMVSAPAGVASLVAPGLFISILTGDDDRRQNAFSTIQVKYRDGRRSAAIPIRQRKHIASHSRTGGYVAMLPGTRVSDIESIEFVHDGAPRNSFEQFDNWKVTMVELKTARNCESRTLNSPMMIHLTGKKPGISFSLRYVQ